MIGFEGRVFTCVSDFAAGVLESKLPRTLNWSGRRVTISALLVGSQRHILLYHVRMLEPGLGLEPSYTVYETVAAPSLLSGHFNLVH